MAAIRLADKWIGDNHPCFVVAEAGVNHNGRVEVAKQLIDVAAEARADAVKFQAFHANRLTVDREALETLRGLELPENAFAQLRDYCRKKDVIFLSTPFDEGSADLLNDLGVPAFKVGSGDITHHRLLAHIARFGKPVILSTGMAFMGEVEDAVRIIQEEGNDELALLHCISHYPTDPREANLRAIRTLQERFDLPVGFSDHTLGTQVSLSAVALGASILEKHFTLDRSLPGPDHVASLEPPELLELVRSIRAVEATLGDGEKKPSPSETEGRESARRSLVANADIPTGSQLEASMIAVKRPGTGIPPKELGNLVGRRAKLPIPKDTLIAWDMVE